MLASDVISDVRRELNDETLGVERWKQSELFTYLTFAQAQTKKIRPDLFLDDAGAVLYPVTVTSLDTVLPGDSEYLLRPLALHVCYQALFRDGDDQANRQRGEEYLARWENALVGGAARNG